MIWWELPLPSKINFFLWLAYKNRILTKNYLAKKRWKGNKKCQFCPNEETIAHLFLNYSFTRQIWFWMGQSQNYFHEWQGINDTFKFACTPSTKKRTAFLIVFSSVCWTILEHNTEMNCVFRIHFLKPLKTLYY